MDLCAEMMHANMEVRERGISRASRVRMMLSGPGQDSVTKNPLSAAVHEDGKDGNQKDLELADMKKPSDASLTSDQRDLNPKDASAASNQGSIALYVLWFLIALGLMSAWNGMMANIGPFKKSTGESEILLFMNLAYFVPALPVLILNITYVARFDMCCGTRKGYLVRVTTCFLILIGIMISFPLGGGKLGKPWIIGTSVAIGVFGGLAYGSIFQLNALFSAKCSSLFSMGLFAPGFAYLFFHLGISYSTPTPAKVEAHWFFAAGLTMMGLICFLVLMFNKTTIAVCALADEDLKDSKKQSGDKRKGKKEVLQSIWMSLLSIFISIFAIVAIISFFTKVPSTNPALPATLFYVKNGADFLGRCLTLLPTCIKNQKMLLILVILRFAAMPLFFLYVFNHLFQSDIFVVLLIGVSAVTSGYLNTACYVQAGQAVERQSKPVVAGLMNLSFQISILASLGFGLALVAATG